MLGTGSAGLLATYAIAAVMLVLNYLLGLWWNKHLPPPSTKKVGLPALSLRLLFWQLSLPPVV